MGLSQTLKDDAVSSYLDLDGLGKFQDELSLDHVKNDNGILIAAYIYAMVHNPSDADKLRFQVTMSKLTVKDGLYKRRPYADSQTEAHDNYSGIAATSALMGTKHARDIVTYGEEYGWQYANTDNSKYSFAQLRQGGDIAFYQVCAGDIPYLFNWAWLCLGLIYAYLFGWSSTWNLAWLKVETIDSIMASKNSLWNPFKISWYVTSIICALIIKYKKNGVDVSMGQYFGPDHVLTRMSKVVE